MMKNYDTAALSPRVSAAGYDPTGNRPREHIRATIEAFLGGCHAREA